MNRLHRSGRRSSPAVWTAAGLLALWLGLTAPSVSPVAAPAQAEQVAPAPVVQDVLPPVVEQRSVPDGRRGRR